MQKLLFQHSKPYSQRYEEWTEEHPVANFAIEAGTSMIPVGRVVKKIPGLGSVGKIIEMSERAGRIGGWGEGAEGPQVAPKYRDPVKKRLSEGYRTAQAKGEHDKFLFNEMSANKEPLRKAVENQGLTSEGPYTTQVYRGGRGQTAPGRGTYYTPDPAEAAVYEHYRRTKGKALLRPDEMDEAIKRIDAREITLKRPFVQRRAFYGDEGGGVEKLPENPYGNPEEIRDLIFNLNLSRDEAKTVRKLNEAMHKPQPTPDQPGSFPNEQAQLRYERYIMRLAKDRGHDSVIFHTPELEHYEVVLPHE